ncbi:unnamed protein product [Dracunculus medinensis]|uniref:Uncharacterized protein n=1 Tax=Dracunculus medinensis TaxID=318479 RepID=A0A0N4UQY1_DRAME|nr:unnamed protein product [Dracunculus medinensis]
MDDDFRLYAVSWRKGGAYYFVSETLYHKSGKTFEERRTLMAKKIKGSQKSDSAKFADLFVHIGDAEIKGNLPVEGIFNTQLYRESLNDANDQQLEQENHLLKIIKIEKARALADATETEQELARIKSRIKSLTNIYNSQKHLYDDLQRNDEKKRIETKNLNNQISDREKSCKQIKKALENDKKLTEKLELNLAKLKQQISEMQQKIQQSKLSELEEEAKINTLIHERKKRNKEQKIMKEKFEKTLNSLMRNAKSKEESDILVTTLKKERQKQEIMLEEREKELEKRKIYLDNIKSKLSKAENELKIMKEKCLQSEKEWNQLQNESKLGSFSDVDNFSEILKNGKKLIRISNMQNHSDDEVLQKRLNANVRIFL